MAERPALIVTTDVPPDRVGAFAALARRRPIELALFGGGLHATRGVHDHGLPAHNVSQREVYALAASGRYDAVMAGTVGRIALPAAWLGAERARAAFVLWSALWAHPRSAAHLPGALLLRLLYRRADAVVTYGAHVSRLAERCGARRTVIAPQAVDVAYWSQAASDVADGPPSVLFVGRDDPGKGVDTLLAAWEAGGFAQRGAQLTLAGPQPARVRSIPGAHAVGSVEPARVRELLAGATVLVVPSERTATFREPWGLVVNEAMHAHRLVVASTQVGAVAGGLVEHERTGLVFPAGDVDSLAATLRRALDDEPLRRQLASAGRQRAEPFTWEAWATAAASALGGSLA